MEQRDSKRAREEALDVEKARGSLASENISRDLRELYWYFDIFGAEDNGSVRVSDFTGCRSEFKV